MIKALSKRLNNNSGFTLIELIVVIAILGILAGVAAPNIIRYVNESRVNSDISNGAIIANGILRAVAEGKTVKDTGESTIEITEKLLLNTATNTDATDGDVKLIPDFVQNLPEVKQHKDHVFGYSYNSESSEPLKIYVGTASATTFTAAEGDSQVYPAPDDED